MTSTLCSNCVIFQNLLQNFFAKTRLVQLFHQSRKLTHKTSFNEIRQNPETFGLSVHGLRSRRLFLQSSPYRSYGKLIKGKAIANQILKEVKPEIETLSKLRGRIPLLSVVLVGEDAASQTYVRNKIKTAANTGIQSEEINLPDTVTESDLLQTIENLNRRGDVDAILVQLPLPEHINERSVCDAVTRHKDVDGFHVVHMGQILCDVETVLPCTPAAVLEILHRTGIETCGKKVTIVGRSKHVCLPLAIILQADGRKLSNGGDATVTICHRYTSAKMLSECTRTADIIISGTGVPHLITGDMVQEGAVVIDVGFSRLYNPDTGKSNLIGDVDFQGVSPKASFITPVPGGVGPVTIAMLMKNTLRLAKGNLD